MSPEIQQVLPKYMQVADQIRDRILRGELQPGDEIPSERQIVNDWQVSRPTATRALAALRAEGLVEAKQGSGTFVRERPSLHRRARDRYARSRATGRMYTPGERSEILDAELAIPPEEVAAALGLEDREQAIRRRRVVYDSGGPVEVSTSWLHQGLAEVAPRLLKRSRIREGTLAYVERVSGRRGYLGKDWIGARLALPEEAAVLGLGEEPDAILAVRHMILDDAGEPIEFAEAVFPPGRWSFEDEYLIPG